MLVNYDKKYHGVQIVKLCHYYNSKKDTEVARSS